MLSEYVTDKKYMKLNECYANTAENCLLFFFFFYWDPSPSAKEDFYVKAYPTQDFEIVEP